MAQVGIAGNIQEVYGSSIWANDFALGPSARNLKTFWNFEEFFGAFSSTAETIGIWTNFNGGAGAIFQNFPSTTLRPGIIVGSTGTTVAGFSTLLGSYAFAGAACAFGAGVFTIEADINLPLLSAVAEEYIFRFGFGDDDNADFVDGCYFEYDRLTNVNWLCKTASNSARTASDSLIPVAAAAWIRLKIVVNVDATAVAFYINDVLVATNVLTIPSGDARIATPVATIVKSAGVTARTFLIDWAWLHIDLLTSR